MKLQLLGGFALRTAAGRPVHVPRKKSQALLAYLANPAGRIHPRDKLAALLWPEAPDPEARRSLRQALFALRRCLGEARSAVSIDEEAISLAPEALDVDVAAFERLVADGTPPALEEADRLYQGDFLAGLAVSEPPFEEWLLIERERLREVALEALARLLADRSRAGDVTEAVRSALRLLALDPLQEAVHRTLMSLHARQGRRDAALRQYQVCVAVLRRELGIEPDPETRELYRRLLRHERVPSAARPRGSGTTRRPGADWNASLEAADPPLVGREPELARLERWLDAARQGRGRAVAVVGEAGIGKSRLLREIIADAVRRGYAAVAGRASPAHQTLPFGIWTDAVRLSGVLEDAAFRQRLDRGRRAELARLFPELGEPPPSLDAEARVRLFEALVHVFEQAARTAPTVLVLEDLHWADELSVRLTSLVARRLGAWPLLLLASARTEEIGEVPILREVLREESFDRIDLGPLSREKTAVLVRALDRTGHDDLHAARLGQQIWDVSAGNPFMVVETMREVEDGAPSRATSPLPLPERIRQVVLARVERLGEPARRLAAVASVVGREFEVELLARAAGLEESGLVDALEELVRRRVLQLAGEHFDFVHDWMREVLYANLLPPRRSLLHRQVAEAVEQLHGDNLDAQAAVLGRHYLEAEVWTKAATYLKQAAARAMAQGAHREASLSYQGALDALEHLPRTPERVAEAIDLRLSLRLPSVALGDWPHLSEAAMIEVEKLAEALGDPGRLAQMLVAKSYYHFSRAEYAESLRAGRRSAAVAHEHGNAMLEGEARVRLGWTSYYLGDFRYALEELGRAASVLGEGSTRGVTGTMLASARLANWTVRCLAELGEFDAALAHIDRALGIAEERNHQFSVASVLLCRGIAEVRRGEAHRALATLDRATALCVEGDFAILATTVGGFRGAACLLAGRVDDALPLLRQTVADARPWLTRSVIDLAEACLEAGNADEAQALASGAVETAGRLGERGTRAWGLRLLGEIAARRDRGAPTGERSFRDALELAAELGMRPLVAHCELGLATLAVGAGERSRGLDHVTRAADLYRQMGMRTWLARAEAVHTTLR